MSCPRTLRLHVNPPRAASLTPRPAARRGWPSPHAGPPSRCLPSRAQPGGPPRGERGLGRACGHSACEGAEDQPNREDPRIQKRGRVIGGPLSEGSRCVLPGACSVRPHPASSGVAPAAGQRSWGRARDTGNVTEEPRGAHVKPGAAGCAVSEVSPRGSRCTSES